MAQKEVWIFDAGNSFTGNPKWLFMYMEDNHKEIKKYWFSNNRECVKYVRKLGFKAYLYRSLKAKSIMKKATTYVVEQCKEVYPEELRHTKILNLWHGVGCKAIERESKTGFLTERLAKKYITNNEIYLSNQLFLVTSPFMEKHFKKQCGIADDMVLRAGYPRCLYQGKVKTFNHDILAEKGLPEDTKIVVYAPTYRDGNKDNFFSAAIPDMEKLVKVLEDNNQLMIFKLHPFMLNDQGFVAIKDKYENHKRILFWDGKKDIYEIFNRIDLAIIDYSSMFYDFLAAGIKKYIRYIFDYDSYNDVRSLLYDYKEMTCGVECYSFDALLEQLSNIDKISDDDNTEKIKKLFWEYSDDNSLEKIVQETLKFKVKDKKLKTLYSFDVFDTLIQRKCGEPKYIFNLIKEKMIDSNLGFKSNLVNDFVNIRMETESYLRHRKKNEPENIPTQNFEIQLREIHERIGKIYNLNEKQVEFLINTEMESEIEAVLPKDEMIKKVLDLLDNKETVVLISDMYLPKECIQKMLAKANKRLAEIPLFLSSDKLVQKTTKKLFLQVYYSFDFWDFGEWVHYGDNEVADINRPMQLGINPEQVFAEREYNDYETNIQESLDTYDATVFANNLRKFRENASEIDYFSYGYVCLYWVPYVNWAIKDALKKKTKTLYFISRDGFFLKQIADELIKVKHYDIKTKYIYGSRKAWRIPSFIDEIDDEFFSNYGNVTNELKSFSKLLSALNLTEEEFDDIFPALEFVKKATFNVRLMRKIRPEIKNSERYKEFLLDKAAKLRPLVLEYINQEIDFSEKFAFVEYWGRGYTQTTFHRLLKAANAKFEDTEFYYARSIYQSEPHIIRNNFMSNIYGLTVIEALFSNVPKTSVTGYKKEGKTVVPVMYDNPEIVQSVYDSVSKTIPIFVKDNYSNEMFYDEDGFERNIFIYALRYMNENKTDKMFLKYIAILKDSVIMYGSVREFAPKLKLVFFRDLFKSIKLEKQTSNMDMSLARSNIIYRGLYNLYRKVYLNKKLLRGMKKVLKKAKILK